MSIARIGVNGFGRIGRLVTRASFTQNSDRARVMQINDPFMDKKYLMYLLKHDSVHGRFECDVQDAEGGINVDGHFVAVTNEMNPADIPWGKNGADFICESTGVFTKADTAGLHLAGGAKKAIISCPAGDNSPMFVMGVNNQNYTSDMNVVSNASCTTTAWPLLPRSSMTTGELLKVS